MPERWFLAIDLGTTDMKIGAVSAKGALLAHHTAPVDTQFQPGGGAVQDTAQWRALLRDGVRSVAGSGAVDGAGLAGVGITGQWGSTVPVGEGGEPVGPCMLWSDTRGAPYSAKVLGGLVAPFGYSPGNIIPWIRMTGGAPSPHGGDPLSHELYMRNREPELYARTAVLLEPVDFLGLHLTGRAAATPGSSVLSWLADNRPGATPAYAPELIRRSTRDEQRLPQLIATGSVLGNVAPDLAADLGIGSVPVVAGVSDAHSAYLGSGAVGPYEAHVTISTTCWISCEVPFKKTDVFHQIASVPGLRPGRYLVIDNQETAGLSLKWLRDGLVPGEYEELTTIAAAASAGSGGVMFTPWLNGERTPVEDRTLRGAFLNLSVATTRADIVRSVLEGVAFNARWLLESVESFVGRRLDRLRIQGGGAQSDLWCQVYADVLDRPLERVAEPRFHSLRGAGLFAGVSLGEMTIDDIPSLVPISDTFSPRAANRAVYDRMFGEFKGMYGRLHGTYSRLNSRVAAHGG